MSESPSPAVGSVLSEGQPTAYANDADALEARLAAYVGRVVVEQREGPDAVNLPMIRHWVETMEDTNPAHLDEEAARATGRPGIVAPATMVQAFTMPTYTQKMSGGIQSGMGELFALLDEAGYTSVVATNSEYEFERELVLGDTVSVEEIVESISPEKKTGLGTGRFLTTVRTYRAAEGEVVATQRWRLLKFRPPAAATAPAEAADKPTGLRPRPAINLDNQFFWDGVAERELRIQRCLGCASLRHPPGPVCPECGSYRWNWIVASGRGTLYSYVIGHHPKLPGFDYPLHIGLIELEEGPNFVTDLVDVTESDLVIGNPFVLDWLECDPELTLPVFRPAQEA
ncbi:MAG: MaoC family dehydratase N-terminal domain-containing protein [Tetrasphaera sp.]|nr:MaoC family dehydratase N-terminal domain-containing protein [Tetrasphaera sp.]